MTGGRASAKAFTFIETLVGIIVLALTMAAVAPLARQAVQTLGSLSREEKRLYSLSTAYDLFRTTCERTSAPPWIASSSVAQVETGSAKVAYLDGKADEAWSIAVSEDGLSVETREARIDVEAERARIGPIESEHRIIGLEASFEALGRTWTWKGYFGAPGY